MKASMPKVWHQKFLTGILFVSVGADGLRKINAETLYSLLIGASISYLTWTLLSVWVYSGYYKRLGNLPFPTR